MILIILLAIGFWYGIQAALNAIFKKATGNEMLGKIIATVIIIIGLVVYSALNE